MLRIKHLFTITLTLILLLNFGIISHATENDSFNLHLTIDNKPVKFDNDMGHPYLTKTDRTMVPIRIISENMGYEVDWSKSTWQDGIRKVWINDSKTNIELEINKTKAIVNGKVIAIDADERGNPLNTRAELIDSRTYVPLRFITEAMKGIVEYEWVNGVHHIDIYTGKVDIPVEPVEPTKPTESKIRGNVDEMTTDEQFEAIREFFGENQKGSLPRFQPSQEAGIDGAFIWLSSEFAQAPYEVVVVLNSWYTEEREKYGFEETRHLYKLINPTAKEIFRFYLPNGGADELYELVDDGYNGRLGDKPVIGSDISDMLGADRPVKIEQGHGTRIHIGR